MRGRFLFTMTLSDLASLAVAMVVAALVQFNVVFPWQAELAQGQNIVPLLSFLVGGAVVMSLSTSSMSGHGVPRPSYGRLVAIVGGTVLLVAVLQFLFRDLYYSRLYVATTTATWAVLGIAHRFVRRRRPWIERFLVISDEKSLVDELDDAPHAEVVARLDPRAEGEIEPLPEGCSLAVDLRAVLSERVAQYVSSCDLAGYTVRPLVSVYQEHTGRVPLVHLAEGWEISTPLHNTTPYLPGKRLFDTLAVSLTLPLWVPLGLLVGAFIRLSSPGPVIFRQRRIGRGGEPFTMVKFRTMRLDAEVEGPRFAARDDHRLIRGGTFLRRSRLDEIPQLWNVLVGDMSLVGPRAEQVPFVRLFRKRIPFYDLRHLVRPGITGWAQVSYGYADDAVETIEKLSYDLYYIQRMSPVFDLAILWRSIWTVLTGAGAR